MRRRAFLAGGTALASAVTLAAGRATAEPPRLVTRERFGPQTVRDLAMDRASRRYVPRPALPAAWRDFGYDAYRRVWFEPRDRKSVV